MPNDLRLQCSVVSLQCGVVRLQFGVPAAQGFLAGFARAELFPEVDNTFVISGRAVDRHAANHMQRAFNNDCSAAARIDRQPVVLQRKRSKVDAAVVAGGWTPVPAGRDRGGGFGSAGGGSRCCCC